MAIIIDNTGALKTIPLLMIEIKFLKFYGGYNV
jgi:hypothetical protein